MERVWLPDRRRGWGSFKNVLPYSVIFSPRPKKSSKTYVSLKSLKKVISRCRKQYAGSDEHDAHEFFRNLIGLIHEELTPVTSREVEELCSVDVRLV